MTMTLHFAALLGAAGACALAAFTVLSVLAQRRISGVQGRAGALIGILLGAVAAVALLQATGPEASVGTTDLVAWLQLPLALVAIGCAVAVLSLRAPLRTFPSVSDLVARRDALVEEIAHLAEELQDVERARDADNREALAIQGRFEAALQDTGVTIVKQNTDLVYTWAFNPRSKLDADTILGKSEVEALPPDVAQQVIPAKKRALETGQPEELEVRLDEGDGSVSWLRLQVTPNRDERGTIVGITSTAIDITAERRQNELLESLTREIAVAYERFDTALSASPVTVMWQDLEGRYEWVFNLPPGLGPTTFIGRTDAEVLPAAIADTVGAAKARVIETGRTEHVELPITVESTTRWYDCHIEPRRENDVIVGTSSVVVDVTDRKRAEQHLRLVMRELTHRSKNLLAVIQAMARQTAANTEGTQAFLDRFGARLRALGEANDLLVAEQWRGADLHELVRTQLAHQIEGVEGRVRLSGPTLVLSPEATQNLGLAIHELSTNATKYGALSSLQGSIDLEWAFTTDGGTERFVMTWREIGGPTVVEPSRRGFGRTMIETIVPRALNGKAVLSFDPAGLSWHLDASADAIRVDEDA
ncbi:sensor histidine kinase [Segnochrobactrum spirostomi]|uniref:Blue-light-activated histidine kinase n=1 Tax=Segnochrobactrum spirostomi TaxID=2608987 RepID=A0A6A7Y5T4_9HYPH|nr:HWE histidine kinase domain-containing protein [Segnochrobactrum spirostomi]MQT14065.1 PAS domain-containing protein [Segnochrobactrum spirostomi]